MMNSHVVVHHLVHAVYELGRGRGHRPPQCTRQLTVAGGGRGRRLGNCSRVVPNNDAFFADGQAWRGWITVLEACLCEVATGT
jgi:hypothetical protein